MMLSCAQINKLLYANATGPISAMAPASSSAPHSDVAPSSGAPSEISSADSDWSDIRAIALKLGVANPDDLHTERFKVDRQKLEQMLKGERNRNPKTIRNISYMYIRFITFRGKSR